MHCAKITRFYLVMVSMGEPDLSRSQNKFNCLATIIDSRNLDPSQSVNGK